MNGKILIFVLFLGLQYLAAKNKDKKQKQQHEMVEKKKSIGKRKTPFTKKRIEKPQKKEQTEKKREKIREAVIEKKEKAEGSTFDDRRKSEVPRLETLPVEDEGEASYVDEIIGDEEVDPWLEGIIFSEILGKPKGMRK